MRRINIKAAAIAALLASSVAALAAGNNTFFTSIGDLVFPFTPPPRDGSGNPGTIDNMSIGQTTPRPGAFTTLTSTSAPSGAGITALFASPPAIGGTAPAAGKFTALEATTTFKSADGVVCPTYAPSGTPAATDVVFFIATRPYILVSASAIFSVTAGGASKLQVVLDTGTNAPGTGTDLLTNNTNTGFDLAATANTTQVGTLVAQATRTLAAGDRLSVDYANAIQSSAGVVVTACLAPQ